MSRSAPASVAWAPRCLRRGLDFSYEIRDERGKRVAPTLAGYRLRPGRSYRLVIRANAETEYAWDLEPQLGSQLVEWGDVGPLSGGERRVTLRTRGGLRGSILQFVKAPAGDLRVRVVVSAAHRPRNLRIPFYVSGRWMFLPVFLIATVGSLLLRFISFEAMLGGLAALCVGTVGLFFWERYRVFRRAKERTQALVR